MNESFFDFVKNTTRETFSASQRFVFDHPDYHPYSDDLEIMESFLDNAEYQKTLEHNSINTILSARAHLYKSFAMQELENKDAEKFEMILAHKILEGMSLTGDGSLENAYVVTRISDERDLLRYLQEELVNQQLVQADNRYFDLLECASGKKIYFDITVPYTKMQELMDSGKMDFPG